MVKSEKALERKYNYDQSYLKTNMINVVVSFNRRKEEDMMILEWLNSGLSESKVAYIKRLILQDMGKGGK